VSIPQTLRQLLELAAQAAGHEINKARQAERDAIMDPATAGLWLKNCTCWNPRQDDGQALQLAVHLKMVVAVVPWNKVQNGYATVALAPEYPVEVLVPHGDDAAAATREAIVLAAAQVAQARAQAAAKAALPASN